MEEFIKIILASGKSALDLSLYVLLPVLVIMMAFMKVVEAKGVLALVARILRPVLRLFGVPGEGAFAMIQLLCVSFAAPLATLTIMEKDGTGKRHIAATLAMILTMSQANVVFPLVAVGLDLATIIISSLCGGLIAAAVTYYVFTRSTPDSDDTGEHSLPASIAAKKNILSLMISGGNEAVQIIIGAIPLLMLSIFLVNALKATGSIALLEGFLKPLFDLIGIPAVAVLAIATKYLAGGTAMMGVTINLLKEGAITTLDLNRIAGFIINPCDLVGVAVLMSAGSRCASVVRPAVAGAAIGILVRGIVHLLIF